MTGLIRAAAFCAALALGLASAGAADKAFKRDDLADSAIKLEAQIKGEAGPVAKTAATLRTDADAATALALIAELRLQPSPFVPALVPTVSPCPPCPTLPACSRSWSRSFPA